ncbi:putative transmembrane protein [Chlamydia psittaci 09DC78]|nr:putative transmembrane protein [Chlamydia psittaci 09DC77]EPJ30768.1 putative transmembrane protein [Chlamydia psittaci 09DC78]EPL00731.1 putative transmembrane protein [Chlamydia psittaci 09DC79]
MMVMATVIPTGFCLQNQEPINLWDEFPLAERVCVILSIVLVIFGVICSIIGMLLGSITTGVIGFSLYIISIFLLLRGVVIYNHFSLNYLVYGSLDKNYRSSEVWGNIYDSPHRLVYD